jgi:hypothetical protein
MTVRYRLSLVLASAVILSCTDRSPVSPAVERPSFSDQGDSRSAGVLACRQSYDSVTRRIGRRGGSIKVGAFHLYIASHVLQRPVRITAVTPAGDVRWVRFQPDGLLFPANSTEGWGAVLVARTDGCRVSEDARLRIAQVSDDLGILGYLDVAPRTEHAAWKPREHGTAAQLPHFSNYAIAW